MPEWLHQSSQQTMQRKLAAAGETPAHAACCVGGATERALPTCAMRAIGQVHSSQHRLLYTPSARKGAEQAASPRLGFHAHRLDSFSEAWR